MLDSMRFARSGDRLTGQVPIAQLDRLSDSLASEKGSVEYVFQGGTESGRPVLRIEVDASVIMRCQYCLEPYMQPLHIEQRLPLAKDEAELERWERDDPLLDALVADPSLDVLTLVEDELLLALPVAPRHPDGACGKADGQGF